MAQSSVTVKISDDADFARISRRWIVKPRENGGPLRPWTGQMTHGIGCVGESGAGVWRARTRRGLLRKMYRFIAHENARQGTERFDVETR